MSYEPPSREWSKTQLRELFLIDVNALAPHVLDEWAQEPYSLFLQADLHGPKPLPRSGLNGLRLYKWLAGELLKSESKIWGRLEYSIPAKAFCEVLLEWAAKYNLVAGWVLERAMWTLSRWHELGRQPGFRGARVWALTGISGPVPTCPQPPPGLVDYGWYWNREDYLQWVESLMRERFDEVFKQHPELSYGNVSLLNAYIQSVKDDVSIPADYCDRSDKLLKAHGWVEAKWHRNLDRDMQWAVQFQVLKMELEAIAANTPQSKDSSRTFSVSTVSRAVIGYTPKGKRHVPGLLEKIGLERRPESGPGRRRGSKESADSWRRSIKRAQLPT